MDDDAVLEPCGVFALPVFLACLEATEDNTGPNTVIDSSAWYAGLNFLDSSSCNT